MPAWAAPRSSCNHRRDLRSLRAGILQGLYWRADRLAAAARQAGGLRPACVRVRALGPNGRDGLVADVATGCFGGVLSNPIRVGVRPRPPGDRLTPCPPPPAKAPTAPPLPTSAGHPAPSARMRRWASVLVESADATVVLERRDGLACSAQVKEEPSAAFGRRRGSEPGHKQSGGLFAPGERLGPLAPGTEQNTPARRGALAQSLTDCIQAATQ